MACLDRNAARTRLEGVHDRHGQRARPEPHRVAEPLHPIAGLAVRRRARPRSALC